MIKLGTSDVTPKIGSIDIEKALLGTTEVYSGVGDTYDAEVEYVSFDGTQTLTIPATISVDDVVVLDCIARLNNKDIISFDTDGNLNYYTTLIVLTSSTNLRWWSGSNLTGGGGITTRHVYEIGREFKIDGVSQGSVTINRPLADRNSINLFHRGTNKQKGDFFSLKIAGKFDLIPVRVGTGGYVYDKIHKKLYGDGSLAVGPDVSV